MEEVSDNSRHTGVGARRRITLWLVLGCFSLVALALAVGWNYARKRGRLDFLSGVTPIGNLKGFSAGTEVRIRGVVTYYDFSSQLLYLQDRTGALHLDSLDQDWHLHPGERIEVQGRTTADFDDKVGPDSTDISPTQVKALGESELPAALEISASELPPAGKTSERIELHGIVRSASRENGHFLLDFAPTEAGQLVQSIQEQRHSIRMPVFVEDGGNGDPNALVDADVALQGVVGEATQDGETGVTVFLLLVPTAADVQVERAAPQHPVEVPSLHVLFAERSRFGSGHRLQIRGQVVSQSLRNHILVIGDEAGALAIETNDTTPVKQGETVEVQGFPVLYQLTALWQDGTFQRVTGAADSQTPIGLPILTTAREVRSLTAEQAAMGYPLRIEGVVTYFDARAGRFFVQDSTSGIFSDIKDQGDLKVGQKVRIEGTSEPGGFAPVITQPRVEVLGNAPMPNAERPTLTDVVSADKDARWGEIEGIVHPMYTDDLGNVSFRLDTSLGLVLVHTAFPMSEAHPERYVDAKVRARGVVAVRFNHNRQVMGLGFRLGSPKDLTVLQPPPADPFSAEVHTIYQLLQYSPKGESEPRQRVRGVVTMHRPGGDLYLEDATGGLEVQTDDASAKTGDLVDAAGYVAPGEYSPVMQDAVIRRIDSWSSPSAPVITPEQALTGEYSDQLVAIDARLLSHVANTTERRLVLQAGNITFDAELDAGEKGSIDFGALRDGSVVRLTGICSVQVDRARKFVGEYGAPSLSSFDLLLRSPDDIRVMRKPSWWTAQHALGAVAVLVLMIAATVIWVLMLRKKVHIRTAELLRAEKLAALGRLAAGAAHELNNPLTGILGYIQILLDDTRTNMHREKLGKIEREALRMKRIIENLIRFARPGVSGRQPSDVETIVKRALVMCAHNLKKRDIKVHVKFAPDVPRLDLDENQFAAVFLNLFNNSADALMEVSDRVIHVDGRVEGGKFEVRFSDSGPGFSNASRVFEPFYTTKPVGKGTGLGLSTCYGIVNEHGGEIQARNLKPHGAEVIITFPAVKIANVKEEEQSAVVPSMLR